MFGQEYYVPGADLENSAKIAQLFAALNDLDPALKARLTATSITWEKVGGLVVPQIDLEFGEQPEV